MYIEANDYIAISLDFVAHGVLVWSTMSVVQGYLIPKKHMSCFQPELLFRTNDLE